MKLYTIDTGYFKLDGGAMFGVVPKSIWNKLNPSDENNLCTWAMRCLLIEDGNRLILVDNGIGNKQDAKFLSHYHLHGDASLESSLAKQGFSKKDITDVFLTHLHFDHCGGSVERKDEKLVTAFPNATYWSNERHWAWATKPNDREKASFLKENIFPIAESGQLKFVKDENNIEIFENFSVVFANGHTDAMMLPKIIYKGSCIVYMADLLPSVAHLPIPYVMAYDVNPLETLKERKRFWNEALENDYIFFLEHDKDHECCTLQMTEKGIRQKDVFKLSEL
ncbi:MAG: fold metallo-hydrolase [Chitinophagaceae bacterium]|nr:fold metallo-hydrolase [Chitinophagaceae bacterium]